MQTKLNAVVVLGDIVVVLITDVVFEIPVDAPPEKLGASVILTADVELNGSVVFEVPVDVPPVEVVLLVVRGHVYLEGDVHFSVSRLKIDVPGHI